MLQAHLGIATVPSVFGRGFGLQAELLYFRAFGSIGGLETTATPDPKVFV